MSIIVWAPIDQMVELVKDTERLRQYFGSDEAQGPGFDPFPITSEQLQEMAETNILYITDVTPKSKDYATSPRHGACRVMSYERALRLMNGE